MKNKFKLKTILQILRGGTVLPKKKKDLPKKWFAKKDGLPKNGLPKFGDAEGLARSHWKAKRNKVLMLASRRFPAAAFILLGGCRLPSSSMAASASAFLKTSRPSNGRRVLIAKLIVGNGGQANAF